MRWISFVEAVKINRRYGEILLVLFLIYSTLVRCNCGNDGGFELLLLCWTHSIYLWKLQHLTNVRSSHLHEIVASDKEFWKDSNWHWCLFKCQVNYESQGTTNVKESTNVRNSDNSGLAKFSSSPGIRLECEQGSPPASLCACAEINYENNTKSRVQQFG